MTESATVAVVTFQRPLGLRALLRSLGRITTPDDLTVSIIVVDNDPEGSARSVVEAEAPGLPFSVRYVVETTPGIAAARNRAVLEAGAADHIAFVDDDEVVSEGWLVALVDAAHMYQTPVVAGPVLSVPEREHLRETTIWRAGFFDRPRRRTGTHLPAFAAGNVLIAADFLRARAGPFDTELGLTGGEDTDFALWAAGGGVHAVWCDEAEVHELVPEDRVRVSWAAMRALRAGAVYSKLAVRHGGLRRIPRRLVISMVRFATGAVRIAFGTVRARELSKVRGVLELAEGVGGVLGILGYVPVEYRRFRAGIGS